MEAKELRIGNYVLYHYPENDWDTHQLVLEDLEDVGNGSFKPITLTEEWLLKFGNESIKYPIKPTGQGKCGEKVKQGTKHWFWRIEKLTTVINIHNEDGKWIVYLFGSYKLREIKYIHEYQNLVFALTGKELKTK